MAKVIRYENGLRAVIEPTSAPSVSVGIWVNAGSAKESEQTNGISHFIEHMIFKGTDKLSAFEVSKSFEDRGAMINAFTSKDCTCYFFKSLTTEAEECFRLLSHVCLESVFPKEELDRERKVIVEEINMQEDAPEDICFDLLGDALYDGPLERTILGPAENVLRFDKSDIEKYMNRHYCPENIVISFAGGITAAAADKLVKKHFLPMMKIKGMGEPAEESVFAVTKFVRIDDYEQANLMLGFPSVQFNHPLVPTQALLSIIMGGGMSSRLFQKIREEMGLAYSVYTTPSVFCDAGSFNICVNYTASNTGKILDCLRSEIGRLLSFGVRKDEFERAKIQLKSAMAFSQENPQSQMLAAGKLLLLADEQYDMERKLADINRVSMDALDEFTEKLFQNKIPAIAYVGKQPDVDIEW